MSLNFIQTLSKPYPNIILTLCQHYPNYFLTLSKFNQNFTPSYWKGLLFHKFALVLSPPLSCIASRSIGRAFDKWGGSLTAYNLSWMKLG